MTLTFMYCDIFMTGLMEGYSITNFLPIARNADTKRGNKRAKERNSGLT